jgi:localization factor PodJL
VAKLTAGDAAGLAAIQKLADSGYAPAQFYLGELYRDGRAGLAKDATASRRWLERAAEGGDRTAMHNLALDYHDGIGGARNAIAAAEWFRRAAELGLIDSQYNLAALYEHGDGVGTNLAEAYKWYLIAGRAGDLESRSAAQRVRAELTPEARTLAERAAGGFQSTTAPAPATAAPVVVSADVATAQRALSQLGYYQGPSDGVASQALHLALSAYQRDQGLTVTGATDTATVGKLRTVAQ